MINKQNLWFLTLFSLILVLSIYYVTMPNSVLKETINTVKAEEEEPVANVDESEALAALRVDADEELVTEINKLQDILLDAKAEVEEKNNAYESLKELNTNKGKEEALEKLILKEHSLKSFVKIKNDQIKIVIASKEHDSALANKIIRTVQKEYEKQMYITVKFQS